MCFGYELNEILICTRFKRAPARAHAVVIDKIENGRVFVRDPSPLYQGSYYSVTIEDFKSVFNKKFITLKAN